MMMVVVVVVVMMSFVKRDEIGHSIAWFNVAGQRRTPSHELAIQMHVFFCVTLGRQKVAPAAVKPTVTLRVAVGCMC